MTTLALLTEWLESRLSESQRTAFAGARDQASAAGPEDFCAQFSRVSRIAPRGALEPTEAERAAAAATLEGWDPEGWTVLETARVAMLLARPDLAGGAGAELVEEAFRYADVGEQCALYRSLAHLPGPERFAWRAGEGARSNMRVVFEATCCDTPYPTRYFEDVAWRQALIKAIFVEAPLWRVFGLDERLSSETARMALDLADERRSAGRTVNPQLWMCLGAHAGERGLESLERELAGDQPLGRAAAAIALARAGEGERLRSLVAVESDPTVQDAMRAALDGHTGQRAFSHLDPSVQQAP